MKKSDSIKRTDKIAVSMSDHFLVAFCGAILIIDLLVGAIMMVFDGKSFGFAFSAALIITIVLPFVLSSFYGMFVSPSRYDDV